MIHIRSGATPSQQDFAGVGIVLVSALLIGLAPSVAKIAYQEGANVLAVITFRTVIDAIGLEEPPSGGPL